VGVYHSRRSSSTHRLLATRSSSWTGSPPGPRVPSGTFQRISLAGPGTISVAISMGTSRPTGLHAATFEYIVGSLAAVALVAVLVYLLYRNSAGLARIFGATGLPMLAQQNDPRAGFFSGLPHSLGGDEGNMAADLGARLVEGRLAIDFVSLHSSDRKLLFGGRGTRGNWAKVDSTAALALMPQACYVAATAASAFGRAARPFR